MITNKQVDRMCRHIKNGLLPPIPRVLESILDDRLYNNPFHIRLLTAEGTEDKQKLGEVIFAINALKKLGMLNEAGNVTELGRFYASGKWWKYCRNQWKDFVDRGHNHGI